MRGVASSIVDPETRKRADVFVRRTDGTPGRGEGGLGILGQNKVEVAVAGGRAEIWHPD
jgi:hypothetical protein